MEKELSQYFILKSFIKHFHAKLMRFLESNPFKCFFFFKCNIGCLFLSVTLKEWDRLCACSYLSSHGKVILMVKKRSMPFWPLFFFPWWFPFLESEDSANLHPSLLGCLTYWVLLPNSMISYDLNLKLICIKSSWNTVIWS